MFGVQSRGLSYLGRPTSLSLILDPGLAQKDEVRARRLFLNEFGVRRLFLFVLLKLRQVDVLAVEIGRGLHWVHGRETISSASQSLLLCEVCRLIRSLVRFLDLL